MINAVLDELFMRSWWVVLFGILCFMLLEQGMKTRNHEYAKLREHYVELEKQKKAALFFQEKLLLEINSQSDPAWVELILMKGLGVIPEGQTKVFFDRTAANP